MKKCLLLFFGLAVISLLPHASVFAQTPEQRNMAVTAFIAPGASDFQFSMTSDATSRLPQDRTIQHEITYGASSSASTSNTTTITVDFSHDQALDGTHVTDYVVGSASEGYKGVKPVVDLTNRTITWTIPNIPEGTIDQKVYFSIRTNGNYTTKRTTNFYTQASMSNQYATMPTQILNFSYMFDESLVPIAPTSTPGPVVTPIPSPTITPTPLRITDVAYTSITDETTSISVTTNKPSKLSLAYGLTPKDLTKKAVTDSYTIASEIELTNLTPDTIYYFRVTATDFTRRTVTSDIFTFTTARTSELPDLSSNSIVITSGGNVILSDILTGNRIPFGLLTNQTDFQITYTFNKEIQLTDLVIIIHEKSGETRTIAMTQQNARTYTAALMTEGTDIYDVAIRISDAEGNVIEQNIAHLKAISPIKVIEAGTNLPLADARIYLWYFNENSKQYEPYPSNPLYTDASGKASFLLPPGKYRAEASALWHPAQTVDFTLGQQPGEEFPTITLTYEPLNITSLINHVANVLTDTFNEVRTTLQSFMNSSRFFNAAAAAAVGSTVFLSSFLFSLRTDIRWKAAFPFFLFFLYVTAKKHKDAFLYGSVTGEDNSPITLARVEVIDLKSAIVLAHTTTNKAGHFAIRNTFKQNFIKLLVTKDGFKELETTVPTTTHDQINLRLSAHSHIQTPLKSSLKFIFGELFEVTLLLSLLAELLFLASFGIAKTLPFFAISLLNLILWLFFVRQRKLN